MHRIFLLIGWLFGVALVGSGAAVAQEAPRIQLLGDSMMATHRLIGRSIPDVLGRTLDVEIANQAASGAMIRGISRQYESGEYDWVVLNGGGNDMWLGCGCRECEERMDMVIGEDGMSGRLPQLVARILKDGAQVLYVGYLRSPGFSSPIENCRDEGDEMERRVALMASKLRDTYHLSNADLVPSGDRSFHAFDRIHPSIKGSRAIAQRIANFLSETE